MSDLRNQVKDALANLMQTVVFPEPVNGSATWISVSRRLKMFNQIDPSAQPACFVVQHTESYVNPGMGTPPIRILTVGLWCFASTKDETVIGDSLLDSMLAGIENVFTPDDVMNNELTFGGLCTYAKIDMRSNMLRRDPGDIDGQALLILPVRIMLP